MLTELHALVMEDPLQGVRDGIEDLGGRSEAEEEHGVNVDPVIQFDYLQLPILRVNWHQSICSLNIYLCQQCPFPQPRYGLCCHVHRDILQRTEAGVNAIIDAGTLRVGQVRDQPPLPSVVSLRDHSKAVQVEILGVAIMKWAQEATFSKLIFNVSLYNFRVLPG